MCDRLVCDADLFGSFGGLFFYCEVMVHRERIGVRMMCKRE